MDDDEDDFTKAVFGGDPGQPQSFHGDPDRHRRPASDRLIAARPQPWADRWAPRTGVQRNNVSYSVKNSIL